MNNSQVGEFDFPSSYVKDNLDKVAEVFSKLQFVPVRVEQMFWKEIIQYVGFSPLFDEVSAEAEAPYYHILITEKEGKIHAVGVRKGE